MDKKHFRRIGSLALALAMILGITAGCSSNTPPAPGAPSGDSQPAGSESPATHSLAIMGPESSNTYIKFANRDKYLAWQELDRMFREKGLDITFEIIQQDQYQTTIQTRVASDKELPNFCNTTPLDVSTLLSLAESGKILPVNKIMEENGDGTAVKFFNDMAPFARKATTAPDGNRYWIPSIQETTYQGKPASTCMMVAVRKDWLDALKLPVPTNAEEFIATLHAFQDQDANGNGLKDEIFGTNTIEFACGVNSWFGLPGVRMTADPSTGKIVTPWLLEGAPDYFRYMQRLIAEGLLDPTLIGAQGSVLNQLIAENKVGATFTYAMQTWLEPTIEGATNPVYQPIGPLPAAEGITPISSIEAPQLAWQSWAVTNSCKDLDGMGKFLDILCSEKFADLTSWGIEGVTYEVKDGIKTFLIEQSDWKTNSETGNCPGGQIWEQNMFPKIRFAPMETEINSVEPAKRDYQIKVIDYKPAITNDIARYLAVPTQEEQARLAELERDFKTFSKELATDLILGNRSVDNWNQYIKELKETGLEEIMEIYQARFDRYLQS